MPAATTTIADMIPPTLTLKLLAALVEVLDAFAAVDEAEVEAAAAAFAPGSKLAMAKVAFDCGFITYCLSQPSPVPY